MRILLKIASVLLIGTIPTAGFAQAPANSVTKSPQKASTVTTPVPPAGALPPMPVTITTPNAASPIGVFVKKMKPADTQVSMSFDKADIGAVLKFLSMASGTPIVVDPELKGNVTIISLRQIPLSDAFEVVNAALHVRGYTMVGNFESKAIRVLPMKRAVADNALVRTGKDPESITADDVMITQVMPLEFANASKLREELKPLVSDDSCLVSVQATNTLIISDNSSNVHRIAEIVKELDKDSTDVVEVEIHHCKYASAINLADTLAKIFPSVKQSGSGQGQPNRPGGGDNGQPQTQVKSDDGIISLKGDIRVTADQRTNSLVISASRDHIKLVLDVVNRLDVDTDPEVKMKTFPLQYADAKSVADTLNKLFEQPQGGVADQSRRLPWEQQPQQQSNTNTNGYAGLKRNVVVADMRTNSIIVTATDQNMRSFENMIKELDAPKVLSEITRVFPLAYAKAVDLADSLNRLFRGQTQRQSNFFDMYFYGSSQQNDGGPLAALKNITVVAEEKTNSLLVTGPPNSFAPLEEMIKKLDKRSSQVFIEVAIVDVTLDNDTKFGIEWNWQGTGHDGSGQLYNNTVNNNLGVAGDTTGLMYNIITGNWKAWLHAVTTRSYVKVLSTPTIMTADNQEGTITIGQDQPFVSTSSKDSLGNPVQTLDYKKVAVSLNVTPHINGDSGIVSLDVHQTINEVIGQATDYNAPIVADREAQTKGIMIKNGETVVIGGIMKENKEKISTGIPILSSIPLIGNLFKSSQWKSTKSELMVFLTPHILADDASTSDITKKSKQELSVQPKVGVGVTGK